MSNAPAPGRPVSASRLAVSAGDRYELNASSEALRDGRLVLEPAVSALLAAGAADVIVEAGGTPAPVRHDTVAGVLLGPELRGLAQRSGRVVLECLGTSPCRFRIAAEPVPSVALPESGGLATDSVVP